MDKVQKLALVIPCFNEARRLDRDELQVQVTQQPYLHIILVDDGSTDETGRMIAEIVAANPDKVRTISLGRNQGKAAAVRAGILAAIDLGFPLVGYWDADLATPLREVPEFLRVLDENPRVQLVLGSRVKLLGREIRRRAIRHYVGRVFATAASVVLALPVYDTQCGAKIFRVEIPSVAASEKTPVACVSGIRCLFDQPFHSRWIFDVEILARFQRFLKPMGLHPEERVFELPLREWRDVGGSKVRMKDFFVALYELARLWIGYRNAD